MTVEDAIAALEAAGDETRATEAAAYHKAPRRYLGVPVPVITALAQDWRADLDLPGRVALADALWRTDIHEARVAAAKLLMQARIRDDGPVWELIASWVPAFDGWAIADHVSDAGGRRLVAEPSRIALVEDWIGADNLWTRRAALVMTLPWTKQNHPTPEDLAIRERVLAWAAVLVNDPEWFIQKAVASWLRELSKHDPARVSDWLKAHGGPSKPFTRKEAAKYL